jgi:hypothetical protein
LERKTGVTDSQKILKSYFFPLPVQCHITRFYTHKAERKEEKRKKKVETIFGPDLAFVRKEICQMTSHAAPACIVYSQHSGHHPSTKCWAKEIHTQRERERERGGFELLPAAAGTCLDLLESRFTFLPGSGPTTSPGALTDVGTGVCIVVKHLVILLLMLLLAVW